VTAAIQAPDRSRTYPERPSVKKTTEQSLEYIGRTYGVPARIGAPVEYGGMPGLVVAAGGRVVIVLLDGESRPRRCHPRWQMTWLEENGPATHLPALPAPGMPPGSLIPWALGESQWSGC
jgi:hypothetical protein